MMLCLHENIRLLITGGSGFIGTNAVAWAEKMGLNFANFDIESPSNSAQVKYWIKGDIRESQSLLAAFDKFSPSHILHLAAKTGMDIDNIEYFSANTEGVQNLIDVSRKVGGIQKILFTSSLLVCQNGYIPRNVMDYCPPNFYGQSKMIGEKLVRETTNAPFDWVIVRPTSIWGPWFKESYSAFFRTIRRGLYFHPGSKNIIKPASYVGNTIYMMMKMLMDDSSRTSKETFYLADYPSHSTREWAETIQKNMNVSKIKSVPIPMLKVAAVIGDFLKRSNIMVEPPLTSFRLKNMLTGGVYPLENTIQFIGDLPVDLDSATKETISWMISHKLIKPLNPLCNPKNLNDFINDPKNLNSV